MLAIHQVPVQSHRGLLVVDTCSPVASERAGESDEGRDVVFFAEGSDREAGGEANGFEFAHFFTMKPIIPFTSQSIIRPP